MNDIYIEGSINGVPNSTELHAYSALYLPQKHMLYI